MVRDVIKIPGESFTITAGSTASRKGIKAPATYHVIPGGGGTMTVQVRLVEGAALIDADADNASYSAATVKTLNSPVYEIVFGAVTADGTAHIAECP